MSELQQIKWALPSKEKVNYVSPEPVRLGGSPGPLHRQACGGLTPPGPAPASPRGLPAWARAEAHPLPARAADSVGQWDPSVHTPFPSELRAPRQVSDPPWALEPETAEGVGWVKPAERKRGDGGPEGLCAVCGSFASHSLLVMPLTCLHSGPMWQGNPEHHKI